MDNSKQQSQSRFLTAAALSMVVLLAWMYFFAPQKPKTDNTNTSQTATANTAETPKSETPANPVQNQPSQALTVAPDNAPSKIITVETPLYKVRLDSKGAVATSWILLKDKSPQGEKLIFADGSTKNNEKPLELISSEALNRNPREVPFRLSTGDPNLDGLINERNYTASVNEENIKLEPGQEKQIDFVLNENGFQVTKTFVFRADNYVSDLQTKLTKDGQIVPNTKLLIGASISDQGIPHHNLYHIESEAVAYVDGEIRRHQGYYAFKYDNQSQSVLTENGNVNWAGVGDAYFAMVAVPADQTQGIEYRALKYEVQTEPFYDGIFNWILRSPTTKETRHLVTTYVPIKADGSTTKIYTGTKDYFALNSYNKILTDAVGRQIDIIDLINFSNYSWLRPITKYLSIPILYSLNFLNDFTHNYGVAIIIFTFLFYSLLFPLRWSQSKSFKKASSNAPKMKEIQDKIYRKKACPRMTLECANCKWNNCG
jgi:YidC/Oxa1 family membrane protein insertase